MKYQKAFEAYYAFPEGISVGAGGKYRCVQARAAYAAFASQQEVIDSIQAKLDGVMLEHCPDEMSEKQVKEWGNNQVLSSLNVSDVKFFAQLEAKPATRSNPVNAIYSLDDLVQKKQGSKWRGKVVGFYSTEATPIGYSVESLFETGSVQVWPEAALIPYEATI